jgi:SAM-dependent methyltransferase
MGYPVEVALDDDQQLVVELRWPRDRGSLEWRDGWLHYNLHSGAHVYLTASGSSDFSVVPKSGRIELDGGSTYLFRADIVCEGGQAGLWLIEYDQSGRLAHEARNLSTGPLAFGWTTHERQRASILVLRLVGTGRLAIRNLAILKTGSSPEDEPPAVLTGPLGRWRRWSQFFDPVGYRSYIERHHKFYEDRGAELYGNALAALKGRRRILDVACGPGLLMQELLKAGAESVAGLERDPVYIEFCRSRGLVVHKHDLNRPFPFIASRSFDAVVIHQAIDCMPPLSMRIVLRESNRLLEDGGLLHIAARMEGQQTGDLCRTIRLDRGCLERLLHEAGFETEEFIADGKNFRFNARVTKRRNRWEGRTVTLSSGQVVHPWSAPRRILDGEAKPWDSAGHRDFILLTDERKSIVRQNNRLVAYYTGYRRKEAGFERAVCRAVSDDFVTWRRDPDGPVLSAGAAGGFDGGGVCGGSVLACPDGPAPYVMYYSGRGADGTWPGIGIAFSNDGVEWHRQPGPVLSRESFENIKHLALADVIRTAEGVWLLHAESWVKGEGWAVSQAQSSDGLRFVPTRPTPVLTPAEIPWGSRHVANPKVIEMEPGRFLMGFNAAGPDLDFHIGLAESRDALAWRPLDVNPVICAPAEEFRVESMFMTRETWTAADRRVYFFSSAAQLEPGSRVACATADAGALWVEDGWETRRPARYRIREGILEARPQGENEDGLQRRWRLDKETQACVRLMDGSSGGGSVALEVRGEGSVFALTIAGDGTIRLNQDTVAGPGGAGPASCCLRCIRPWSQDAEAQVLAWQGDSLVLDRHLRLGFRPGELTASISVPAGQPGLSVDSLDVWQPEVLGLEDNHAWMCTVDAEALADLMEKRDIERALVFPGEPGAALDSYDRIAAQIPRMQGRIYPALRRPRLSARSADARDFEVAQLERLWQAGVLFGFEAQADPGAQILQWAQERQALVLWRAGTKEQLSWLGDNVLGRYDFPALLVLDPLFADDLMRLMDGFSQLHLVAGPETPGPLLESAALKFPDRVLRGSGSPHADLDIGDDRRAMLLSENLRFLLERAQTIRWQALHHGGQLRFPRIPVDPAELSRQGFVVEPPEKFDPGEPDSARAYWSTLDVQPFYGQAKPWASWIADTVQEIRAESVLEFGCNRGRNLVTIREALPRARIVGLDINADAVASGKAEHDLDLRVGGEEDLKSFEDDAFDFVFTVSVLDHIADIDRALGELVRVCRRHLLLLEVRLPVEGKVLRHFDHKQNAVMDSTTASYSWHLEKRLAAYPKVARLDTRPVYLHDASLGPCYVRFLASMGRL